MGYFEVMECTGVALTLKWLKVQPVSVTVEDGLLWVALWKPYPRSHPAKAEAGGCSSLL